MSHLVQARLINEPFGDPGIIIDFRFGSRAILFDLGDISVLSARELLRISHVFVSHLHVDHFIGFDLLLRVNLHRGRTIIFRGPPGLTDAVEAKLGGYRWNLLDERSADFVIETADYLDQFTIGAAFRAQKGFRREPGEPPSLAKGQVLADSDFVVECAVLDHGIPSLAFALAERVCVNVIRTRLDALGLNVGPWLTAAKQAIRRGRIEEVAGVGDHSVQIDELVRAGAFQLQSGQRIAYATDFGFTPENSRRLVELARNADQLFIEATFSTADSGLAQERRHLTAAQAGELAQRANTQRAIPMHFSPRYSERPERLTDEFYAAFDGASIAAGKDLHRGNP